MGCPSECELSKSLVFSVTTHSPDTGAAGDADTTPIYYIYENETGTALVSGVMAKLDDSNTTGLYTEQVDCTEDNGFEVDGSYTIYIEGTVGGVTASISFGFRVVDNIPSDVWSYVTRTLTQSASSIVATVTGDNLTIHRGDTLNATFTGLANNTGWEKLWFTIKAALTDSDTDSLVQIVLSSPSDVGDGLVYINGVDATGSHGAITVVSTTSITVTMDAEETANLVPAPKLYYDIQMQTASGITTVVNGSAAVTGDVSRTTS